MARHDAIEGSSMVTVHVYRAERGGYWAEMPEYPGCYTQGDSLDEVKENVREAVQCYIDAGYVDQRTTEIAKNTIGNVPTAYPLPRSWAGDLTACADKLFFRQ